MTYELLSHMATKFFFALYAQLLFDNTDPVQLGCLCYL